MSSSPIDRLARVEEGDSNRSQARNDYRTSHHHDQTRALLDRDETAFVHQSLSTPCLNVLDRCEGSWLIDVEGRRILDFHGNGVHVIGFAHPRVVDAVSKQLARLPFSTRRYTNEPVIRLAEKLGSILPGGPWRSLLAPAGCLAVGTALKAARLATRRYKAVGMWGSFHGASLEAISIGGERMFRDNMGPLMPGALHVHPWKPGRSVDDAVDEIERLFRVEGDIGALLAEPVRWSTITIPPVEYWQRVRHLCDEHGVWLIFDEIGTCMGRTGRWHAFEQFGVVPDAVVLGKALGAGVLPLAAVAIRADRVPPELTGDIALGHYTHEKNPLAATASLAAIEVIESDRLLDRATNFGKASADAMREKLGRLPGVVAIRQTGMMFAIELSDESHAERVMYRCLRAGLSFKVSSGRVLTLVGPMNIAQADMTWAIETLHLTIAEG
jgi:4-aminobutyrate aminotransferase